ncbi:hypothetical protein QBC38DRAFT_23447 [Podospora fimiseda]|uniref:Uncharacterized protein n=1 Tax=Podospora fimiseda TaxID=252190 RepID=A0AAN7GQ39_9PEZI|nr:hypothetical protein QBC38DRAFT_23447 [Podospora fimiseda]
MALPERDPIVMAGKYSLSLFALFSSTLFLEAYSSSDWVTLGLDSRIGGWDFCDRMRASRIAYQNLDGLVNPVHMLTHLTGFEATDPHDRVFGILGLLPSGCGIVADYSLSVEAVYARMAEALCREGQGLDLLSHGSR